MALANIDAMKDQEKSEFTAAISDHARVSASFWAADRYYRLVQTGNTWAIVPWLPELEIAWRIIRTVNAQLTWKKQIDEEITRLRKEMLKVRYRLEKNANARVDQKFIDEIRTLHEKISDYKQHANLGIPVRIEGSMQSRLRNSLNLPDKNDNTN